MQNVFDYDPPFVAGAFETTMTNRLPTSEPVLVRPAKEEILVALCAMAMLSEL